MSERHSKLERFDDYVSGTLSEVEAEDFEEALFAGEFDEEALFFDELGRNMRFAARYAPIGQSVSRELVEELRARGVSVHMLEFFPDQPNLVQPWPTGQELIVACLHVDARGYDRIDVRVEQADGTLIKVFHDGGCSAHDGYIYAICEEPLARIAYLAQPEPLVCHVLGERAGVQTELATFSTCNS